MGSSNLMKAGIFLFALILIGTLYYLTEDETEDPCANPQGDISGAVLAEEGEQDALINRAIVIKENCKKADK